MIGIVGIADIRYCLGQTTENIHSLKEINRNLIQMVRKQPYDEIEEFFPGLKFLRTQGDFL